MARLGEDSPITGRVKEAADHLWDWMERKVVQNPDADANESRAFSLAEQFALLEVIQNIRIGILERFIAVIHESMGKDQWRDALEAISKVKLEEIIPTNKKMGHPEND